MEQTRGEPEVCTHMKVRRNDGVLEVGSRLGEHFPSEEEDIDEGDRLRVGGLPSGKRHQVIDDAVGEPRAALDLGQMRLAARKVLPREVDVRRDDLESVPELVSDLSRDFSNRY
jgi:hypothetical protein